MKLKAILNIEKITNSFLTIMMIVCLLSSNSIGINAIDNDISRNNNRQIHVINGGLENTQGSGSSSDPYQSLFEAVKHAKDGDSIVLNQDIVINGNSDFIINKNITIDGQNKSITLRGHDIVLEKNVIFKDIALKFLVEGPIDTNQAKVGKIVVNDYELTLNNVSTIISDVQKDEVPIILAGKKDSNAKIGSGAKINIINSKDKTKFKDIILGNLTGVKDTSSEINLDQNTVSELGIKASSNDNQNINANVNIILNGNKINRIVNGDKTKNTTVTIKSQIPHYGLYVDKVHQLILESGSNITLEENTHTISNINIKSGAELNLDTVENLTISQLENNGILKLNPNNQLSLDSLSGNGKIKLSSYHRLNSEKEFITFKHGNASDLNFELEIGGYETQKTENGYKLVKKINNASTQDKDKYTPKLLSQKLEVEDPSHLTHDEQNTLVAKMQTVNKDNLPSDVQMRVEQDENILIIFYNDGSNDEIKLDSLVVKKGSVNISEKKDEIIEEPSENPKVKAFKEKYQDLFKKDKQTIQLEDKDRLNQAIHEHSDSLTHDEQAQIEIEKLTELYNYILKLEETEKENIQKINQFKKFHEDILAKTIDTVRMLDHEAIELALKELESFESSIQKLLEKEKTLLKELETKVIELETINKEKERVEALSMQYYQKYQMILDKKVSDIVINDGALVNQALNEYSQLEEVVKNLLADQKILLDQFKAKIEELNKDTKPNQPEIEEPNKDHQPKPIPKPEKHNEFINNTKQVINNNDNKILPDTGYYNNHTNIIIASILIALAIKTYKKED